MLEAGRLSGQTCCGLSAPLRQVTVELKNDLAIKGTLHSVDQYLNIKLNNIRVVNEQKYPHLVRHIPVLTPDVARMILELPACKLPVPVGLASAWRALLCILTWCL